MSNRPLWRERILVTVTGLFGLELVWTAVNFQHRVGPPILGSLPVIINSVLIPFAYWRTATWPGVPRVGRRFWRTMTVSSGLSGLLMLYQIPEMAEGVTLPVGPVNNTMNILTMVLMMVALFRLPLGARSRSERFRLTLDGATVILPAMIFTWYLSLAPVIGRPTLQLLVSITLFSAMIGLAGVAVVKVLLAGSGAIDTVALRVWALGVAFESGSVYARGLFDGRPQISTELIGHAALAVFVCAAAVRQRRVAGAECGPARPRGPFSLLPYVAVASVDALLLVTLRGGRPVTIVVGGTAVLLTALVIIRQLAAFRDNSRLLDELARQEQRFRALVQNAADGIAICALDGTVTYASPGVERVTGRRESDWPHYKEFATIHPDDAEAVAEQFRRVASTPGGTAQLRTRVAHVSGEWRWVQMTLTNQLDVPGVSGIVINLSDITAAEQYHRQLSHQASHDSLTDLANRSLFGEALDRALADCGGERLSLALIDLDDFKSVNDTLGHQAGDALLIEVAERLRRGVRPQDLVARLGGDEFAVLLENVTEAHLAGIIDRIMYCLTEPLELAGHEIAVRASVGVADARPGEDAEVLVSRADLAMYEAKNSGKGQYRRYTDTMLPRGAAASQLTRDLLDALTGGEFELYYQPIVTVPAADLAGVEVLLRWRHPERGLVPPLEFIPQAEQTGVIVQIGRWVLAEACRQAAKWHADHPATAPAVLNVNVSPRQLLEPSFVDDVRMALADSGLAPERLMIEVTESTLTDARTAIAHLQAVRDLGVRVALDDFGTGQSTLSILDTCPVDQLKLDRSFIPEADRDSMAVAVARIAEALGTELVAEGVEEPAHVTHLHTLGYTLAQGFYFCRPMPGDGITRLLVDGAGTQVPGAVTFAGGGWPLAAGG